MSLSILNNVPAQRAIRTLETSLAGVGASAGALASGDRLQSPVQKAEETDQVDIGSGGQPQATSADNVPAIESEASVPGKLLDVLA